jgi:hypothetical protein
MFHVKRRRVFMWFLPCAVGHQASRYPYCGAARASGNARRSGVAMESRRRAVSSAGARNRLRRGWAPHRVRRGTPGRYQCDLVRPRRRPPRARFRPAPTLPEMRRVRPRDWREAGSRAKEPICLPTPPGAVAGPADTTRSPALGQEEVLASALGHAPVGPMADATHPPSRVPRWESRHERSGRRQVVGPLSLPNPSALANVSRETASHLITRRGLSVAGDRQGKEWSSTSGGDVNWGEMRARQPRLADLSEEREGLIRGARGCAGRI